MKKILFCAICAFAAASSLYAGVPVKSNSEGTEDISIMSFYVGRYDKDATENRWEDRLPGIVAMIMDEQPAVMGLQALDYNQREDLDAKLTDYACFGAGVHDGMKKGPQNTVYYRKDVLELLGSGTFWFSATPDKPKTKFDCAQQNCCASWGVFRLKESGRKFILLNTSLDYKSAECRGLQARMILEKLDEYGKGLPAIVTGNFNEVQAGTFGKDMNNPSVVLSTKMIDGRRLSLSTSNEKTVNNYGKKKGKVTDFIFYSPALEGLRYKVLTGKYEGVQYLSAHNPVRNVLRFLK